MSSSDPNAWDMTSVLGHDRADRNDRIADFHHSAGKGRRHFSTQANSFEVGPTLSIHYLRPALVEATLVLLAVVPVSQTRAG